MIEIQEKAWVYEFPGTKVQDDDLPYVSFVLSLYNEVKSSVTNQTKLTHPQGAVSVLSTLVKSYQCTDENVGVTGCLCIHL